MDNQGLSGKISWWGEVNGFVIQGNRGAGKMFLKGRFVLDDQEFYLYMRPFVGPVSRVSLHSSCRVISSHRVYCPTTSQNQTVAVEENVLLGKNRRCGGR